MAIVTAITQARMASTRLPGKVLKLINGTSLLELHLNRVKKSQLITDFIVATTDNKIDEPILSVVEKCGWGISRGSEEDVLDRFYQAVKNTNTEYVVRITADCPLIDATLIDKVIHFCIERKLDYASNVMDPTYPDGQDVEVFTLAALKKAWHSAKALSEREHVTPYIWKNSTFKGGALFKSENFSESIKKFDHLRMTVDEPEDFDLISKLVNTAPADASWLEYAMLIEEDKQLRDINQHIGRNEGYQNSIKKDK